MKQAFLCASIIIVSVGTGVGVVSHIQTAFLDDAEDAYRAPEDDATSYFARGYACYDKKDYTNAVLNYSRAIDLNPYLFSAPLRFLSDPVTLRSWTALPTLDAPAVRLRPDASLNSKLGSSN